MNEEIAVVLKVVTKFEIKFFGCSCYFDNAEDLTVLDIWGESVINLRILFFNIKIFCVIDFLSKQHICILYNIYPYEPK